MTKTPLKHLAIIMDGNGRWAQQRGLNRTKGHEKGAETIRDVTTYCAKHPTIESVTFYAFSTENWKRPKLEVDFLMRLLDRYLQQELETYLNNNICFMTIGNTSTFSPKLQKRIEVTTEATKHNTSLIHILALNYGGRAEIVHAVNSLIKAKKEKVVEEDISSMLQTPYSDIDLLIRTSGEERVSNYLLWQISYAELYFTQTFWPDFTTQELDEIITDFEKLTRRFGGLA
ncbi:MAG: di-trans,poly-cis-decaprenylcistransferase [Sulfurovum sp.]|nr:di-trans,poly-cis-decaprenylcistransferase [Sulfurovum sp.]MCB4744811.1 di-trans,poly-cis-decaprenylcistransferase [Sulfurovum sp.]MCB4745977.1 di-trans,poly-cis-decaprenylcistransferase [Sulfurovum sp.]MCB4748399.1 di-trans,poly-cis-decaprenylcistransferase [Sulfurovum sp.]MCB4748784.1 di-trans,poly-cis-decaprenylcistransferase [Sulfurovum sp.]